MSDVNLLDVAKQYLSRLSDGAGPEELDSFLAPDVVQEEFPNRLVPHGAAAPGEDRRGQVDCGIGGGKT